MATNYGKLDFAVAFNRQTAYPLDGNAYFESKTAADTAIAGAKDAGSSESQYYYGQLITVYESGSAKVYQIQKQDNNTAILAEIGGSATDANITNTTPSKATSYYPIYTTGVSGKQTLRANADFYYYDTGTSSYICAGSSGNLGGLTLQNGKGNYANLVPSTSLTANHTLTMPNKTGTIAVTDDLTSYAKKSGFTDKAGMLVTIKDNDTIQPGYSILKSSSTWQKTDSAIATTAAVENYVQAFIPSGTIKGSGTAPSLAWFDSENSITCESAVFYDGDNKGIVANSFSMQGQARWAYNSSTDCVELVW